MALVPSQSFVREFGLEPLDPRAATPIVAESHRLLFAYQGPAFLMTGTHHHHDGPDYFLAPAWQGTWRPRRDWNVVWRFIKGDGPPPDSFPCWKSARWLHPQFYAALREAKAGLPYPHDIGEVLEQKLLDDSFREAVARLLGGTR